MDIVRTHGNNFCYELRPTFYGLSDFFLSKNSISHGAEILQCQIKFEMARQTAILV